MENYVQWERHPMEDCYHIYSDGTRVSVLFEKPEDFVFARNLIAVLAFKYHIRVYCDVVMDSHFHLVGRGRAQDVELFKSEIRRLLTRYFIQTHRPELLKEGIFVKADPLPDDIEVMGKIIYVFRNPMDAGFPYLPENYTWGVGRLFFHTADNAVAARRVGDMTLREKWALFHTRVDLPDDWEVDANGMILPFGENLDQCQKIARITASVSHNHPEGVKGAEAVASAIHMGRIFLTKDCIKAYIEKKYGYNLSQTLDQIRPSYEFDPTCPGSVPEAIICFLEGHDVESTIRNAVSLGGDADTQACIAGAIAGAYYGEIPRLFVEKLEGIIPDEFLSEISRFLCLNNDTAKTICYEPSEDIEALRRVLGLGWDFSGLI